MIKYFIIEYKLLEKNLENIFSKNYKTYFANVIADTVDEAITKLKKDFHMMEVNVIKTFPPKEISIEEYENG